MKKNKDFVLGFLSCAVLILACFTMINVQSEQNAITRDNFFVVIERAGGVTFLNNHNVITNIGENNTAGYHWDGTQNNIVNYISTGNATAGVSLTQLTTQYNRTVGTVANWTNSGDYAYNVSKTFMFNETVRLDCAGLHWASSGDGNLYAVANFSGGAVTFNANDNLTITWVVTFDCN